MKDQVNSLVKAMHVDRKRALEAVSEIEYGSVTHEYDQWRIDAEYAALAWANRRLYVKLVLALEVIGAPILAAELKAEFRGQEKTNYVTKYCGDDCISCPATELLEYYLDAIHTLTGTTSRQDRDADLKKLELFLQGTPKMIHDRGVTPGNETEVKRVVYEYIIHLYSDTMREVSIPNVAKTYKPDFGVGSLKAAIEYKFCGSDKELNTAIDGVFADVQGYAASLDWENFFAVFYVTKPFLTPDQLKSHAARAKIPDNWKFIMVTGSGERKRKSPKNPEIQDC